jgi:hypothetical protein
MAAGTMAGRLYASYGRFMKKHLQKLAVRAQKAIGSGVGRVRPDSGFDCSTRRPDSPGTRQPHQQHAIVRQLEPAVTIG